MQQQCREKTRMAALAHMFHPAHGKLHPKVQFSWKSPSSACRHLPQEGAAVYISNTSGKHQETTCRGVLCTIQWANACLASPGLKVLPDSICSLFKLSNQVLKAFLILLNLSSPCQLPTRGSGNTRGYRCSSFSSTTQHLPAWARLALPTSPSRDLGGICTWFSSSLN